MKHAPLVVLLCGASLASQQTSSMPSQRRGLPPAFESPPFPSAEYQGYPLIGVPPSTSEYPFESWLRGSGGFGAWLRENRLRTYGWLNASANVSSANESNQPTSYWIVPKSVQLEQALVRVEREVDTAQQDHFDWGFRTTLLYGTNYRYMTSGGVFSDQLLENNRLYGFDPTEVYLDLYVPRVARGLVVRLGRWVACPDIETQFAPDNYLASHSLLFSFDTYTQTGAMATLMLDDQWSVQAGIHAGTDMAPWYEGATPTGMLGVRWVAADNRDSLYVVLNAINDAKFRRFEQDGRPAGHDNFNYLVATWQHRFTAETHTKTEGYFMWQRDTVVGGTPSLGPVRSFGGGGGLGADIPGTALTYGAVNYTMHSIAPQGYLTFRNEIWRDEHGARAGFPGTYTSHTFGLTWNLTPLVQVRPEIGYYRNWTGPAFDLGSKDDLWLAGFDVTVRF